MPPSPWMGSTKTATTFDVIDREGRYLGGAIAPGIETASFHLHQRAAKLPEVELRFPSTAIGKNTEHSMQSGILFGTVYTVDGLVQHIEKELGEPAVVIATGGLAPLIAKYANTVQYLEANLILEGLLIAWKRQQEHVSSQT